MYHTRLVVLVSIAIFIGASAHTVLFRFLTAIGWW